MITETFIARLNSTITSEGQNLINKFFIIFSRFECALKASNFTNVDNGKVSANWDTFVNSIRLSFNSERTIQLKESVDYLINNPPRIQIIDNAQLTWRDRIFQMGDSEINKLNLSIRDIRNNLFHGGKFNGNYQEDVSRNYILLKNSIIILDEWLSLNETVKQNFLTPIS
jgi:hypothetical protein